MEADPPPSRLVGGSVGNGAPTGTTLAVLDLCRAAGTLWVAADATDQPIGFAAASVIDGRLHLLKLLVARTHRRQGLGRALVQAVIDHGRWAFYPAVTLTTDRDLPCGAPFYGRLGFVALDDGRLAPELAAILRREAETFGPSARRVAMAKIL